MLFNEKLIKEAPTNKNNLNLSITSPHCHEIPRFQSKINLAVLASGNGTNFEAISKSINSNYLDAKISVLIVNKEDCNARNRAKKLGVECLFIDNKHFTSREAYEKFIICKLKAYKVEAIIMAGWMRIVTSELINAYPNRIINIHPSLLPSFKGMNAIKQALEAGVKITGCTVHKVESDVDSGEIIAQAAVIINPEDNLSTLTKKVQFKEHEIFPFAIALAASEWRK